MKKFTYHIKGAYPEHIETNVHILDTSKSTKSEFKPVHFYETHSRGRMWVDGVELNKKAAIKARPVYSVVHGVFSWGEQSSFGPRITALAICLHIFKDEQIAVNMYLPFMREVMSSIKNKSFEIDIDLEHFINDHADRLSHNFYTQHFDLGTLATTYEINFKKDRATGNWSADILHQLCTEDITQRKESYEKPILAFSVFESMNPPKPPFDWEKAYKAADEEYRRLFFTPFTSSVEAATLQGVIASAGICFGLYQKLRESKGTFRKLRDELHQFDELIRRHQSTEERKYELIIVEGKVGASRAQLLGAIMRVGVDLEKVEECLRRKVAIANERISFDNSVPRQNLLSPISLHLLDAYHDFWDKYDIKRKDYYVSFLPGEPGIFLKHAYPGENGRGQGWSLSFIYETSKMEYLIRDFKLTSTTDIYNISAEQLHDLYLRGTARLLCSVGRNGSALSFSLRDNRMYVIVEETDEILLLDQPFKEVDEFVQYTLAFFEKQLEEERGNKI